MGACNQTPLDTTSSMQPLATPPWISYGLEADMPTHITWITDRMNELLMQSVNGEREGRGERINSFTCVIQRDQSCRLYTLHISVSFLLNPASIFMVNYCTHWNSVSRPVHSNLYHKNFKCCTLIQCMHTPHCIFTILVPSIASDKKVGRPCS